MNNLYKQNKYYNKAASLFKFNIYNKLIYPNNFFDVLTLFDYPFTNDYFYGSNFNLGEDLA